jgi:hypothetical protein
MIALLLLILAVGAVLGLRFKMFVLAPAMLMISAVTVAFGIVNSQGVPFILLMVFTGLALLQIGYFTGCVLHGYLTFKSQEHDRRPGMASRAQQQFRKERAHATRTTGAASLRKGVKLAAARLAVRALRNVRG